MNTHIYIAVCTYICLYIYISIYAGSRNGLVNNGTELVIKFRARIPQMTLVVLGRAFKLNMIMCYVKKT